MKPTMALAQRDLKKEAVAAVVEEDEDAHQQRAGQHGQRNGQPQRNLLDVIHQEPEQHVRNERVEDLPQRTSG